MPLLYASSARCWLGGSPPLCPPLRPLALGVGCRLGGLLVAVLPWGPCVPCARQGAPSGSGGPPHGGSPCRSSAVSPPSPSLSAVVSCLWVRVPSLPSPPSRPLALSARGCSGGVLSVITALAVLPSLPGPLGVLSPPSVRLAVPPPPWLPVVGACGRSGGGLSVIASSTNLPVFPSLLGVSSLPVCCLWFSGDGTGIALPLAPSDAA